jgi:hypothetical protein
MMERHAEEVAQHLRNQYAELLAGYSHQTPAKRMLLKSRT